MNSKLSSPLPHVNVGGGQRVTMLLSQTRKKEAQLEERKGEVRDFAAKRTDS